MLYLLKFKYSIFYRKSGDYKVNKLREEFKKYFYTDLIEIFENYAKRCKARYDKEVTDAMNEYKQKGVMYKVIAEESRAKIFENTPFYCELGTLPPKTEGIEYSGILPGSWAYMKNKHKIEESLGTEIGEKNNRYRAIPLYTFAGRAGDERQHFSLNIESVLKEGFCGIHNKLVNALKDCKSQEEKDFLQNADMGIMAARTIQEKFVAEAKRLAEETDDTQKIKRYKLIMECAKNSPWQPPKTFFEALNCFGFCQNVISSLEGVGLEGMGRIDFLLTPYYENDIKKGILTKEEAYELVRDFCVMWYARVFKDEDDLGIFDVAFSFTLGGCDLEGKPFCSDVTLMFLRANKEEKLIVPKLKCRFSADSPKEYLDAINADILSGKSNILYENDDVQIPALLKRGVSLNDARNYGVLGCWEPTVPQSVDEHCSYFNILKILELSLYGDGNVDEIKTLDNPKSFEELYALMLENIKNVMHFRCTVANIGRKMWKQVSPLMVISALCDSCIQSKKDYTNGGMKYYVDEIICTGFTNTIDSLLAIKELCYDKKLITLEKLVSALKANWQGYEDIHTLAKKCGYFGDEQEESCNLAKRFNHDLSLLALDEKAMWNANMTIGNMIYREMYDWIKNLRATPDGRKANDWFARGYAPSHIHSMEYSTPILNSIRHIDTTENGGNSVINMTVSFKKDELDLCESLVRSIAKSGVQSLQLNCATVEDMKDAMVHHERHKDLVVRVCGFSAKFIALDKDIQMEFVNRSLYAR